MRFLKSCLFSCFFALFCNFSIAEQNPNSSQSNNVYNNQTANNKNNSTTQQKPASSNVNNELKYKKHEDKQLDKVRTHIVQNGDNVYRIALKYKISQKDLIEKNNLKNENIFVGQKLILPDNAVIEGEKQEQNTKNNNTVNEKEGLENQNLNKVETVQDKQIALVNKIDSTTFIWPVRGTILGKFGSPTKTGKSEGVYIGCENGTVVRATSSGVVSYSDKIVGYGHVILISHYNGFITAYGMVDPLVSIGDKVKKGQVIAYIQKIPQSKRSQLYFSIRKGNKSYDPEKMIQAKISN